MPKLVDDLVNVVCLILCLLFLFLLFILALITMRIEVYIGTASDSDDKSVLKIRGTEGRIKGC